MDPESKSCRHHLVHRHSREILGTATFDRPVLSVLPSLAELCRHVAASCAIQALKS